MTDWNQVLLGAGIAAVCFSLVVGSAVLLIWWLNRMGTIRLKFDPDIGVRDVLQRWKEEIDR